MWLYFAGPKPAWYTGNLSDTLTKGSHVTYTEWGKKYGKIFKVYLLCGVKCTMVWQHCSSLRGMWCLLQFFSGAQPVVVINDAELARCEGKVPYLGADSWHWSNRSVKGIIL